MDIFGRLPADLAEESARNFELLAASLSGSQRELVPFVGAGASSAGITRMPAVPQLIEGVFRSITGGNAGLHAILPPALAARVAGTLGFEVAMSHLHQAAPGSIPRVLESLRDAEELRMPNRCHQLLARWIADGGSVITTNYDRFIERVLPSNPVLSYREGHAAVGFREWQARLRSGGCLFKVHGSFDDLDRCLAAIDDVRTEMSGDRADLLELVMRDRPVCFIGWRGADPDIPPRILQAVRERNPDQPLFWVMYPGREPEHATRGGLLEGIPSSLRPLAGLRPIVGDADALAAEILRRQGRERSPVASPAPDVSLDTIDVGGTPSGRSRFVGIALRLAGEPTTAMEVLELSALSAKDDAERWAAETEAALTLWDLDQNAASRVMRERSAAGDPMTDGYGAFSMTVARARRRPWHLGSVVRTRRAYRKAIENQRLTSDPRAVALHESLFDLQEGKWRLALAGRVARAVPPIRGWILRPFLAASQSIERSRDIHLHGKIEVLVGRALAVAQFGDCSGAADTIAEVDRLIEVLGDEARRQHWHNQRARLKRMCALDEEQPR